ncbi:glycosyltransferase family 4 protein [Candidatus Parcubacteria bacterium]|nr:glycosyltransferase family 4 protein [Candidatus Parcubacteria bacterium]
MSDLNKNKIIGIDARLYGEDVGRGIGRYIKEIVDSIILKDKKNVYIIFLSGDNYNNFNINNPHIRKVLVKSRWYSLCEQFEMPYLIKKHKIDLMHFPHFNVPLFCTVPFIVTIHDLILTKFPTLRASTLHPILYKIKDFAYKILIKNTIKKSEKILTVSQFTKDDIIEQFNSSEKKITITYEGVSKQINPQKIDDKKVLLRYNLHKPYLLYVGSAYPHKNLEILVEVFNEINKNNKNLDLVIVGKDDYFFKCLKNLAYKFENKNIKFPGFIPDTELASFYHNAKAYIFPSLYEGFGLPPLEAMYYACPVLSSNRSCLPEILGDAAVYFNPKNKKEIQEKIIEILDNKVLRDSQIKKGHKQIKKYNWDNCVNQTLEEYNKVLKKI